MRALICGIGGQDGGYLAKLLLDKGYEVYGTSRDIYLMSGRGLQFLGIADQVKLCSMAINDFRSVLSVLANVKPDEVYNLAGQSSVGLSFEQPVETMESIAVGTLNLLEAIRFVNPAIRFYNASSSECFGDTGGELADENTAFRPRSPYAVAKSTAFWQVANYRDAYKLHASSGILFNHESPMRPERFVTRKIIAAACRISKGSKEKLILGDIDIQRDWGWAPDYVEAMWLMTQQPHGGDYVVATGRTVALAYFVERAFIELNLDWKEHVESDPRLFRPSEIRVSRGNTAHIRSTLGWRHRMEIEDVIREMVKHDYNHNK
ncbi:GDP-mannose 4,6-dehydratase [Methylomonas montana]|uniref:GDP-mannose 4,6-dehydratase n=1 Tax=Methylomonas montana TaxID=3058963 RepID=UPI00265A2CC6|nr:GDP-mannose 4,6-dehydratase [Methylomonas montana]WKJ88724.1 GDP-mannose 4,6-dehydratase [Methylomonas montana]